ncbi:insulinase family protein [Sphingomonas aurantiaca]|uniref:insulinase family protein n=1 Tax=Sphingomonas aurantiaca TaxID=185949 RepID=UPI002FE389BE
MRLVTVERHDLPIVTAYLVTAGGAATDPANRPGVSNLTAELMTKGTKTRSATQIARAIEGLGGAIGSDAGATARRSR